MDARRTARRSLSRSVLQAVPAIAVVCLATFICFESRLHFSTVSFLYLIIVVLQSLTGDFRSSFVVSVFAFLCLNYFFVPPIFSFRVSDASDTVALITFLIAGLVITKLTSRAQEAAESERLQRQDTSRLYDLAQQLLVLDPQEGIGPALLRPYKAQYGLRAVSLFDGVTAELYSEGHSSDHLAEKTRDAFVSRIKFQDHDSGVAVRLLHTAEGPAGAIGFAGLRDIELAEPLAALAALMMERSHVFQRACRAAAATETEVFRGAVLDALAHEFKTPLATILTAAGGLSGVRHLQPEQMELVQVVESEASRLGQLTSRLLRLARLDREEVKPQMELIDFSDLVRSIVEQYSRRWRDRRLSFTHHSRIVAAGDRELLRLGVGQLIDNACKYSQLDAEIRVSLLSRGNDVEIRVWNSGAVISAAERVHIFSRFYRGTEARRWAAGSGLGLYVARKIAVAHGGNVTLDNPAVTDTGNAFRFTLPISQGELEHETRT